MFKIMRKNRKVQILIFLVIIFSNLYALSQFSQNFSNIEDNDGKSNQMGVEPELLKSSSTIQSTTITKSPPSTPSYNFYVNMPSYRPNGHLYIAQIIMDDDASFTYVPSGWTEIENDFATQSGPDVRLATYWKIGSSEPASYRWSCSLSRYWIGVIYRITSFDSNNPIQASATSLLNSPGSSSPTAPSVTTTVDNSLILRMIGADDYNTAYPYWPSGTTGLFQDHCGFDTVMGASAYHTQSTAGSTGSAQFTIGASEIWVATTIAIRPEPEQIPPTFSNLVESADTLELGDIEIISINVSDNSGLDQVLLQFGGSNHSMTNIGGETWQYNSWKPSTLGVHNYTIWMVDVYSNINYTSGSINVVDTTAPTYSDLIESADPLQLGQNETISIKVFDIEGVGVNQTFLEYDSTNHSMNYIGGNTWSWSNWRPAAPGTHFYKIYMQDLQNNWNLTSIQNFTAIVGTAPTIENVTKSFDPLELGNNITITVDVIDFESFVSRVLIEFENINYTMINTLGNKYEFNWTGGISVGLVIYKIHANDTENYWNQLIGSFDIIDTTAPTLDVPIESQNILELGDTEWISVNVTDLGGIKQAKIEFEGANHSMIVVGDTCSYDFWTPTTIGLHYYTIHIQDKSYNWGYTIGNITVQDTISPAYSNLTVSANPVEIGDILTFEIIVYDIADMNSVKIEYQGLNHSMTPIGGDRWHYDSWSPTIAGNYSYIIYMRDNNNNWNITSNWILFQDTTKPTYSNLFEDSDPLELGETIDIYIEIVDFAGINQVLIEFEGSNHTMEPLGTSNVYRYNSWTPTNWINYQYRIHMEDNNGNFNVMNNNITVQDTTPPSQPIFTNAPSGEVSGVLTFDWADGSDPSGISYYILMIDNESNPYLTPGFVFMSNITNVGPESSFYELHESLPAGNYYYFLIQIDGVGHQSSYTTGTFTMISNNAFIIYVIIGVVFVSVIGSVTAIVVVKRRAQKGILPPRKKVSLKIVLTHIENISKSSQIKEKTEIHKIKKQKKSNITDSQKQSISDEELTVRINKIKSYGEKLQSEGAYLEAQKQFEFAENILLKLDKNEEASIFSELKMSIRELSDERDKKLEMLGGVKLENDSLQIFETYYDIIELSEKLKDHDSAEMYLAELIDFYQMEQAKLRELEYQRFKLYQQANSFIEEKNFEQSVEFYEKCEKISQFLVKIGKENEKNNVKKFREKIEECLSKAAQK
ncbi:MAG: hypothetical protein EAX91_03540 [Candidatus Lokiarchaeota archaeon]|nr:hypothetical protein [Candidatus Lokiarchaeota archaeon]